MSSNCAPQLHLELPPSTTSFKRSFDQFELGFDLDLENPLGGSDGAGASGSEGSDHNKRARSASIFSDDDVSIGSSHSSILASGSSSMGDAPHENSAGAQGSSSPAGITPGAPLISLNLVRSFMEPARLPTPVIQDIDMEPAAAPSASTVPIITSQSDESYRLSPERFNAFDTQISALRQSYLPSVARTPTPPPVLPPLELPGEEVPTHTNSGSFLHPPARPSPPLPNSLYGFSMQRPRRPQSNTAGGNESYQDDMRRLPHESRPQPAESSMASERVSDETSQTNEVWSRINQETGSTAYLVPWTYWPTTEGLDAEDYGDDDEETGPETRGEIIRAQSHSPVPAIEALRFPSPLLIDDLDDLERTTIPQLTETTNTTPPSLPPIPNHGETWEDPLEALRRFPFGSGFRSPPPTHHHTSSMSLPYRTTENRSNNSTAPFTFANTHTPSVTLNRSDVIESDDDSSGPSWVARASRERALSALPRRNANSDTNSQPGSTSNPSSVLDSYAASRLEALHGIGEALEGIGRVLQDSEITLQPFLVGGSNSHGERSYISNENRASASSFRRRRISPPSPLEDRMHLWLSDHASDEPMSLPPVDEPTPPRMPASEIRFRDIYSVERTRGRSPSPSPPPRTRPESLSIFADDNSASADMISASWLNFSAQASASSFQSNRPVASAVSPDGPVHPSALSVPSWSRLATSNPPASRPATSGRHPQDRMSHHSEAAGPRSSWPRYVRSSLNITAESGPSSSSAAPSLATHVSPHDLFRLRSRPYASQSATHSHTHSYSHSHSVSYAEPAREAPILLAEDPVESRRRNARLGFMRRMSSSSIFDVSSATRALPPTRPSAAERSGVHFDHSSTGLQHQSQQQYLQPGFTPTRPTGGLVPARTFLETGYPSTHSTHSESSDIDHQLLRASLLRNFGPSRRRLRLPEHAPERETFRGYLPVLSLPSPDLNEVFESTTPQTTNNVASEHRRPSIGFGRVTIPAMRRSPSPMGRESERAQRDRSPPRRSRPVLPPLDPESFASGPFRNTIQRFFNANLARERSSGRSTSQSSSQVPPTGYTAPSIPPLPFEDEHAPVIPPYQSQEEAEATMNSRRDYLLSQYLPEGDGSLESIRERSAAFRSSVPLLQTGSYSSAPSRPPDNSSTSGAQSRTSDLHRLLSRRPRIDASRLDEPENVQPSGSRGNEQGFNHALEVLRHDGLSIRRSQELITRYHQERQQREHRTFTTPASPWGIMEQGGVQSRRAPESTTNEVPSLRSFRRRPRRPTNPFSLSESEDEHQVDGTIHDTEHARVLRARRFHRGALNTSVVFPAEVPEFIRANVRRSRALGDYVRDEDFDESYESLLSLAASLGEAKPRCTPEGVIESLETGLYKDWKTAGSDHRCPICLDDYQPEDSLLKLADCSHWLHRECLKQWLKSATTCPVCRKVVNGGSSTGRGNQDPFDDAGPSRRRDNNPGNGPGGSGGHWSNPSSDSHGWMPPWRNSGQGV